MVKASVRAMDMVSEFSQKNLNGPEIDQWGVLGGSKRGWTTWLVGAVDPERVKMIAPIVLDCLNFQGKNQIKNFTLSKNFLKIFKIFAKNFF